MPVVHTAKVVCFAVLPFGEAVIFEAAGKGKVNRKPAEIFQIQFRPAVGMAVSLPVNDDAGNLNGGDACAPAEGRIDCGKVKDVS